jgi:hypothetical protein
MCPEKYLDLRGINQENNCILRNFLIAEGQRSLGRYHRMDNMTSGEAKDAYIILFRKALEMCPLGNARRRWSRNM